MNIKKIIFALCAISTIAFAGFLPSDKSVPEQRQEILDMSNKTLAELGSFAPASKAEIAKAYGYAVFSSRGVHIFVLSNENGSGMAHDNHTGKNVYMNMLSLGAGFGLGIKEFHAVFIFSTKSAFDDFVTNGWEANAQADAAVKAKGYVDEYANQSLTVAPGVTLYKLTDNGLALQATIQGSKYWRDGDLN
ncbi:MAG: hypothetical protein RL154_179 [Pseudomonadota bacterium]|jgi:lipid-binding SYLF domain-containing protein